MVRHEIPQNSLRVSVSAIFAKASFFFSLIFSFGTSVQLLTIQFKYKLLSSTSLRCCFLCFARWFLPFQTLDENQTATIQIKAFMQYLPVVL